MAHARPRPAFAAPAEEPFTTVNTTPLIDVLLVLLIMFIITLPMMTHSVKIDLPGEGMTQDQPSHELALGAGGRLTWDGAPIAESSLRGRLAAFRRSSPDASLNFRAEAEARYEDFDRILAEVKRGGIRRLGFVGNDRFAHAY